MINSYRRNNASKVGHCLGMPIFGTWDPEQIVTLSTQVPIAGFFIGNFFTCVFFKSRRHPWRTISWGEWANVIVDAAARHCVGKGLGACDDGRKRYFPGRFLLGSRQTDRIPNPNPTGANCWRVSASPKRGPKWSVWSVRPKKKVALFRRIVTPTIQKINSHVTIGSVVWHLA